MKSIKVRKPLYNSFFYIRRKYLDENKKLQLDYQGDVYEIDCFEWMVDGKKMKKVFKKPDEPMELVGNDIKKVGRKMKPGVDFDRIEKKLKELRVKWKKHPTKRPLIEKQARLLKIALEKAEKDFEKTVREELLLDKQ